MLRNSAALHIAVVISRFSSVLQMLTTVMMFSKNAAKIGEQLKRSPGYNATGGSGKTSLEINHVCIWCTLLGTVSGVCRKREQ